MSTKHFTDPAGYAQRDFSITDPYEFYRRCGIFAPSSEGAFIGPSRTPAPTESPKAMLFCWAKQPGGASPSPTNSTEGAVFFTSSRGADRCGGSGNHLDQFPHGADGAFFQSGDLCLGDSHQVCHLHLGLAVIKPQGKDLLLPLTQGSEGIPQGDPLHPGALGILMVFSLGAVFFLLKKARYTT